MFGGLLLGKFSKKCKQAVGCIKLRAEQIKKKKRVVVRILKNDVAYLIAAGHEANAFGRMDALIVEMNLVFCYEMIEKFCECISNQLPTLQKQIECPEESMEAISTLIYAAARFSDLPELRDLRSLFTERYGNCMESSVNAEFAEKTNRKSFSREWKLMAMQEIAEESRNLPSPKSAHHAQNKQVSPPESNTESHEKPRKNDHAAGRKIEEDIDPVKPLKPKPVGKAREKIRNETGKSGNGRVLDKGRRRTGATDELENQPFALLKPKLMNNNAPKKLDNEKPKPFAVRKKLQNSPVNDTNDNAVAREELDSSIALRYGKFLRDNEEKILDDLLLYYSRKGTDKDTTHSRAPRCHHN